MKERPILFSAPMVRALLAGTKTQTRRLVTPQPHRVKRHVDRSLRDRKTGKVIPITIPDGWEWKSLYGADDGGDFAKGLAYHSPYGSAGGRLWVRESFNVIFVEADLEHPGYAEDWYAADSIPKSKPSSQWQVAYAATDELAKESRAERGFGWRPGIHMPRWASRIVLEVVGARCERLQAITEDDAKAEGVEPVVTLRKGYPSKLAADVETASYRLGYRDLWDKINGERAPWKSNPWCWVVEFKSVEATA